MKNKILFVFTVLALAFLISKPVFADTAIHLDIETSTGTLYNQDINVAPCDSDNHGTMTVSAYCAILQSGITNTWSWFGTDAFLSSLGGISNDFANNIYWGWFGDLHYGSTSLSAHILSPGEHILVNYNINPLKLSLSNMNPVQYEKVTFTLLEFGLDSSFNPVWTPATGGIININGAPANVLGDGTYSTTLDTTSPYVVSGSATGFLNTDTVTLTPNVSTIGSGAILVSPTSKEPATLPTLVITATKKSFDKNRAFNFLLKNQNWDGSFGEEIYTDWSGFALAVNSGYEANKNVLKDYLLKHPISGTLLTDYERRAMALMSLGINPYDANGINYVQKIVDSFDGTQFGDLHEDNDDIFALTVLKNAGYKFEDKMISDDISFVIKTQSEEGSWNNSLDMTGAGIEALSGWNQNEEVKNSIAKAEAFLKTSQKDNGGWSDNVSSTSWAIEGILALGENLSDWTKTGNSPLDYLGTMQAEDGGTKNDILTNKIWETAYALSASSGKNWNSIMGNFTNPLHQVPLVSEEKLPKKIVAIKSSNSPKIAVKTTKKPLQTSLAELPPKLKEELTSQTSNVNSASVINALSERTSLAQTENPVPSKNWVEKVWEFIFGAN